MSNRPRGTAAGTAAQSTGPQSSSARSSASPSDRAARLGGRQLGDRADAEGVHEPRRLPHAGVDVEALADALLGEQQHHVVGARDQPRAGEAARREPRDQLEPAQQQVGARAPRRGRWRSGRAASAGRRRARRRRSRRRSRSSARRSPSRRRRPAIGSRRPAAADGVEAGAAPSAGGAAEDGTGSRLRRRRSRPMGHMSAPRARGSRPAGLQVQAHVADRRLGHRREHGLDERVAPLGRDAARGASRASTVREVLARVLGLDAHVLRPGADVGEADPLEPRRGLLRRRRSSTARASPRAPGSATASIAACTVATLPAPPHWATSRPPGCSAANRRSNSRSWSAIQWKVAVERIASTGSSSSSSSRSATNTSTPGPSRSRASLDHRGRAVDGDHCAAREPLDQRRGDAAGAAAGVEHALVAAQLEPVEHLAAHRLQRRGDALVGGGVPIPRRVRVIRRAPAFRPRPPRAPISVGDLVASAGASRRARRRRRCPGRSSPAGRRRSARGGSPAPPSSRLSDFRPLWPASPPPSRDADVAERQVDLVVDDEHAVEVELVGAARRADRAARRRSCTSAA